jgi:1-acyl-sn-glycerol-3-phosphate acyltransferase
VPLPPRWVRRLGLAPLVLVLVPVSALLLPLAMLVAALSDRLVPGRHRPLRLVVFAFTYLALEAAVLIACFALWIWSGFGRRLGDEEFLDRHYRLLGWYLDRLIGTARRLFAIRLEITETGRIGIDRPRIVLSRHAGPGDSFLLVHAVCRRNRRPRIVLKDTFQWEPMFDTVLHRLPCRFISPNPTAGARSELIAEIAGLARGMGPRDSLVIFPEGGNITPSRRTHSIAKLEERGMIEQAEQARRMRHVMAPRTGGPLAALAACPEADVAFVAHTGLEQMSSPVDLWRGLPMDSSVSVRGWNVPREGIAESDQERVRWLYEWWKRIDSWIADRIEMDYDV